MRSFTDTGKPVLASARSNEVWKPVIAAVNGVCAGSGLHHVAEADIAIASSSATFLDNHVSVGQAAGLEPIALMSSMPLTAVLRMALVGNSESLNAHDAFRLGFVTQVVDPPEHLDVSVQALAERIAQNSPAAMRHTKQAIWAALDSSRSDAMAIGWQHVVAMWAHPDNLEGPRAFAEKRTPSWAPPSRPG
jgi:enoyl-CoA hydratase